MADYNSIYNKMEFEKEYTASSLGVAPASMTAMVRRGLVEVSYNGSPKRYTKLKNSISLILSLLSANGIKDGDYFGLYTDGARLGMLCMLKSGKVLDCYDKEYNTASVNKVRIGNNYYNI